MMLECCSHGGNVSASSPLSLFSLTGSSSIVLPTSFNSSAAAIVTLKARVRPKIKEKEKDFEPPLAPYMIQRFGKCGSVLKP